MQSEMADSVLKDLIDSNQSHVEPLLIAWHRPSAWQIDPAQDLMKMKNLLYFYTDNYEGIKN